MGITKVDVLCQIRSVDQHDESLSQIAAPLSHALRNPLGAISLHLGIMQEEIQQLDDDKRGQAERSLAIVKANITRLHDLMQQYLLIGRSWHETRHAVDLSDYLKTFCAEMQGALSAHDITLRLDVASQTGDIALYETGFRQALRHVFDYVRATMPRGSTLTVRGHRQGDRVSIDVGDTGEGTALTQLDNVFDPFHDPAFATHGLGLYLVREVVYAHQGDIRIQRDVNVGTTIQITLPLAPPLNALSEPRPED